MWAFLVAAHPEKAAEEKRDDKAEDNMFVSPDHALLQYSGRIDFEEKERPVMIYPASYVRIRFTGTSLRVHLENKSAYWNNYMGCIMDGRQEKYLLPKTGETELLLAEQLENKEHDCLFFKRMDACHYVTFLGFEIDEDAEVLPLEPLPERKIEVYGDSVSAGEVSEAVEFIGQPDPEHNGEYSNSYYSYAWLTARKLGAQLHDVAQGGIALLDGIGWFYEPGYIGMESIYDKTAYHPDLGAIRKWDFSNYIPQAVIVAIGQNDSHPTDFMARDYDGIMGRKWRKHYREFILKLREIYPDAQIILTTTIMEHDIAWDRAIEEVCESIADANVHHFLYRKNGCGTKGHIRIPEAEEMAEELAAYIEVLWEDI